MCADLRYYLLSRPQCRPANDNESRRAPWTAADASTFKRVLSYGFLSILGLVLWALPILALWRG